MSSVSETSAADNGSGSAHTYGAYHGYGSEHGSLRGYLTGFGLSVVLTFIPFWLVMGNVLASTGLTVFLILTLGVVQIFVHVRYFLHVDTSTEGGWQLMALIFALILLFIVLVGSIWVMNHLHMNMMYSPIPD